MNKVIFFLMKRSREEGGEEEEEEIVTSRPRMTLYWTEELVEDVRLSIINNFLDPFSHLTLGLTCREEYKRFCIWRAGPFHNVIGDQETCTRDTAFLLAGWIAPKLVPHLLYKVDSYGNHFKCLIRRFAERDNVEALEALIKHNPNIFRENFFEDRDDEYTPIYTAVDRGSLRVLHYFIIRKCNIRDSHCMEAAKYNQFEALQMLLGAHPIDKPEDIQSLSLKACTVDKRSGCDGRGDMLKWLMAKGATLTEDHLVVAIQFGTIPFLDCLRHEMHCSWNNKAIIEAMYYNRVDILWWLAQHGCPLPEKEEMEKWRRLYMSGPRREWLDQFYVNK